MLTRRELVDKIKSMTAKEIIESMIEGLKNPVTQINMTSYGFTVLGNCYGCAATNAICKIGGIEKEDLLRMEPSGTMSELRRDEFEARNHEDEFFIQEFEGAIDYLRIGVISDLHASYNRRAKINGFAEIHVSKYKEVLLPKLQDDYTNMDLEKYQSLADSQ